MDVAGKGAVNIRIVDVSCQEVIVSKSLPPSSRGGVAWPSLRPGLTRRGPDLGRVTYLARTSWAWVLGVVERSWFLFFSKKVARGLDALGRERFYGGRNGGLGAVSVVCGFWPGFPALDDPQQGGAMFFHAAAASTVTHGQDSPPRPDATCFRRVSLVNCEMADPCYEVYDIPSAFNTYKYP